MRFIASCPLFLIPRRIAEELLVASGKMGEIAEARIRHRVLDPHTARPEQVPRQLQTSLDQPFLRRRPEDAPEVAVESRQAAARVVGEFRERHLHHVVLFHKIPEVDFPAAGEVEQGGVKVGVGLEEAAKAFRLFHVRPFPVRLLHRPEIGQQ